MKVDIVPKNLKLRRPLPTSYGTVTERRGFEVTVTEDGISGRGEAFPLEAFGTESQTACEAAIRAASLRPIVAPEELEMVLGAMREAPAARFALECALLEWLANKRGVGVASLLGTPRPFVTVNALIEGKDAPTLAANARRAVDSGFKTVKIKVGAKPLSVDAQRLHQVRVEVGSGVALRIDANGGWSEGTARSALRGLESLNIELCEQPVSAGDVEGLRRVTALVPVPVAADEALSATSRRERVLESDPRPAAQVLVLKPAVLGGIVPALKFAKEASAMRIASYVTTLIDGPISRAATAHLAALVPAGDYAHGLSTVEMFEGIPPDAFTPRGGTIVLPDAPGWGV
jgi:o-succinylbenzoate synthase